MPLGLMLNRCLIVFSMTVAGVTPAAESFPPFKSPGDTASRGTNLQRTMTLLKTSAVEKKNTVRILFYGQSITEQPWWKLVQRDIETRYPLVNLIIENRAIGGHSSQLLCRTESDWSWRRCRSSSRY